MLNILLSPIGCNDGRGGNFELSAVFNYASDSVTMYDGRLKPSEVKRNLYPDKVYILVTRDSSGSAQSFQERFGKDKVVLVPEPGLNATLLDPLDLHGMVSTLWNLKQVIIDEHPGEKIKFFFNITPGNNVVVTAFAMLANYYEAHMWYFLDEGEMSDGLPYRLYDPVAPYDTSRIKGDRRPKVLAILEALDRAESGTLERGLTRSQLSKITGIIPQTMSYNIEQMFEEELVWEDRSKRRGSVLMITKKGRTTMEDLRVTETRICISVSSVGRTPETSSREETRSRPVFMPRAGDKGQ